MLPFDRVRTVPFDRVRMLPFDRVSIPCELTWSLRTRGACRQYPCDKRQAMILYVGLLSIALFFSTGDRSVNHTS